MVTMMTISNCWQHTIAQLRHQWALRGGYNSLCRLENSFSIELVSNTGTSVPIEFLASDWMPLAVRPLRRVFVALSGGCFPLISSWMRERQLAVSLPLLCLHRSPDQHAPSLFTRPGTTTPIRWLTAPQTWVIKPHNTRHYDTIHGDMLTIA